jgi:hypothetical protein
MGRYTFQVAQIGLDETILSILLQQIKTVPVGYLNSSLATD